jgi:hypothetical protein
MASIVAIAIAGQATSYRHFAGKLSRRVDLSTAIADPAWSAAPVMRQWLNGMLRQWLSARDASLA